MATIRKRNGRWQVQIRKSGKKAISRTFILKQDALFWAREQERVLELETDVLEKKKLLKRMVADLLHDHEQEVGQYKKSYYVEKHYFVQLRDAEFASLKLDELRPADIQAWVNQRNTTHKASSTIRLLGILSRTYNHAIKHHSYPLLFNPVERVNKPSVNCSQIRRIPARVVKLLENPSCTISWIALFALETGMRRSEIANLEWSDVDFEKKIICIRNTKNGHDRTIPLSTSAMLVLKKCNQRKSAVFNRSSNAIRLAWGRYRKRHQIEGVRFHDLRHEAISRLFEKGLTIPEVATISGHKTISQLFRYAHADFNSLKRIIGA